MWVGRLDVLVRAIVDAELFLTGWICQQGLYCGVDMHKQPGCRKAFDEEAISTCNDGVPNDVRIRLDEPVEAAVDKTKTVYVARAEIFEAFEDELRGHLCYVDNGIAFLLSCHVLALHALRLLIPERQRCRLVLEWLVIVTGSVSWHC